VTKINRKLKRKRRDEAAPHPLLQKAIAYFQARNWQAADETCRELLRRNPGNHMAMNLLGIVLTNKPDFAEAEKYVLAAIKIKPNEPEYYSNLGLILKEQDKWDTSFDAFAKACKINPHDAESLYNLGTVYQALLQKEQAMECYRKAIKSNPDHVLALCTLCSLLSREQESREELSEVMQQMEALLSKPGVPAKEKICFVLGRVHDRLGDHQRVFEFLDPANRIVRDRMNYDVENEKQLFQTIEKFFTSDLLNEKRGSGSDDPSPIFIVGMPRSGTTLVEQILASHSQVAAGGELHFLQAFILASPHLTVPFRPDTIRLPNYSQIALVSDTELQQIAQAYLDATAVLKKGKKHFTDKMPHNFMHIGMIKLLFPKSKVIHCQRDPMDNGLSLYMQDFKTLHPYMYSLKEIGEYYIIYRALMEHWQRLLPGFIHDIRYENLVAEPEQETRRLLAFCGLEWEEACLEFYKLKRHIKTASMGQADQPLYTSSINRWKKYEQHLQPLQKVLREGGILP